MNQTPLPELLRPKTLEEFIGQEHLVGKEGILYKLLTTQGETGRFPSLIFWGPPGSGKTTLARIVATQLKTDFYEFSAVNTSIKEIMKIVRSTQDTVHRVQLNLVSNTPTLQHSSAPVVFIDEIHRFNKAQQDTLLPHVEKGDLILIGATTENPSFEIIGPLLSRTRVLILNQHPEEHLKIIAQKALNHLRKKIEKNALDFLLTASNGDARVLLNVLEISSQISETPLVTLPDLEQALQRRQLSFDLQGEEYYNTISALHKSIRGSDPDGALYWLARMLESGQDPLYIARRLIRASAEDIGIADPRALLVANAAFEACSKIGMPECSVILAECIVYLAKAPKSNALYLAYDEAKVDVNKYGNLPVPLHIRNAVTKLMKEVGYGKNYDYSHSPTGEKKEEVEYLPEKLKGKKYFSNKFSKG